MNFGIKLYIGVNITIVLCEIKHMNIIIKQLHFNQVG